MVDNEQQRPEEHPTDDLEIDRVSTALGERLQVDPETLKPEVRAEFAKRSDRKVSEYTGLFVEHELRRKHAHDRG
jgi:hypothetical protein